MADDGLPEQQAILQRVAPVVGSGLVFPEMEDSLVLVPDPETGLVPDYLVVVFGEPFTLSTDRSMAGTEKQPLMMPVMVECYTHVAARAPYLSAQVRGLLNGFIPVDGNSSAIEIVGGGSSPRKSSSGRPTRFMRMVSAQTIINLATEQAA